MRFHQGPARELYGRYNTPYLEMAVAYAITAGVLDRQTIPAELLDHLAGPLQFYESDQAGDVTADVRRWDGSRDATAPGILPARP